MEAARRTWCLRSYEAFQYHPAGKVPEEQRLGEEPGVEAGPGGRPSTVYTKAAWPRASPQRGPRGRAVPILAPKGDPQPGLPALLTVAEV